jgi:phosphomannomutase/phosphoglucomutase
VKVNPTIFREYDIRGIVDKDLTPAVAEVLGKGLGTYFRHNGRRDVVVGRDVRLSSPAYFEALTQGLLGTGCDVTDLGTIPTPLLYFAMFYLKREAGIVITGSHNPPEYNGFKIMVGEEAVYGPMIQDILALIQKGDFVHDRTGRRSAADIIPPYQGYLLKNLRLGRPLKVVIDAGNGTGGVVAVPLFQKMGVEVIPLYCEMDGHFPHHHPDPTLPEAMQDLIRMVKQTGAEAGIGYDGDADRIGIVDDKGQIIWGDRLMIIFCRDILPRHPGATVISEVKSSKLLYQEIERLGGKGIMWKTGHSLIKKKIKEEKAVLAGEMSGHIFFADRYFGFDDAIYASARLLEILSRSKQKLSEMLADLPVTYSTPEIRVYASEEVKFKIVDEVRRALAARYPIVDIDGVRATLPQGWALVRASNTQAALVMRFEADTAEGLEAIKTEVKREVETAIKKLEASPS